MSRTPFVPNDFSVPKIIQTEKFLIRLLEMKDVAKDYDAYMTSIDHLQKIFDPNDEPWPTTDVTIRFALADLYYCEWEHYKRSSFSYGVFNPDDTIELGCVYIHATWKLDHDAQLITWIRKSELESGFDDELYNFAKDWIAKDWPFKSIAYPGREDSWSECSRPLFVPKDFVVPDLVDTGDLRIRLLNMDDLVKDYSAYMSSIEHIRGVFGPHDIDWPTADLTVDLALADLGWCEWEHYQRTSFSYCVMSPDDSRELGCLYVSPTKKREFDAEITLWVTKLEYDNGLDRKLYDFAKQWIKEKWPFGKVAFPGRDISWQEWEQIS